LYYLDEMALKIALVSDFFHPNVGGVENHVYQLAQCLLQRGHKVIVITHSYEGKNGLKFLTNNLRVYYLPLIVLFRQCSLFALFGSLSMIRNQIYMKEHFCTDTLLQEGSLLDKDTFARVEYFLKYFY